MLRRRRLALGTVEHRDNAYTETFAVLLSLRIKGNPGCDDRRGKSDKGDAVRQSETADITAKK